MKMNEKITWAENNNANHSSLVSCDDDTCEKYILMMTNIIQ